LPNLILEVEIQFKNSNSKKFVVKESCGSLSDAEIEAALSKLSALKIHPREKDINTTILARAERLYEENIGEVREELSFHIRKFQAALETQEESTIELARFEFATFLDEFEFAYE
jgi:molecular chaperone HscC